MRLYGSAPILTAAIALSVLFPTIGQAQSCFVESTPISVLPGPSEALPPLDINCGVTSLPFTFSIAIHITSDDILETPDPALAVAEAGGKSFPGAPIGQGVQFNLTNISGSSIRISGLRAKTSLLTDGKILNASVVITSGTTFIFVTNPSVQVGYVLSRVGVITSYLPTISINSPSPIQLSALGGTAPYTWSISSGLLPPGLSLNSSTGAITGTTGSAGVYPFSVTVKDAADITSAPKDFT